MGVLMFVFYCVHFSRQAWNYFLLLPAPLGFFHSHQARHLQAIRNLQDAVATFIDIATQHIDSTARGDGQFLAALLDAEEQGDITGDDVRQLVLEMILAGTDTSSVTMSWLPVAMAEDAKLELELRREIQTLTSGE